MHLEMLQGRQCELFAKLRLISFKTKLQKGKPFQGLLTLRHCSASSEPQYFKLII